MKALNIGYIILFCILLLQYNPINAKQVEKKKIFYLNSYDITFQTTESSLRAINETFSPSEYIIDIDFMDSKRFNKDLIKYNLKERIEKKMTIRGKYDIILASDDNALLFIIENYENLFKNIPVVFWGLDNVKKAKELDNIEYIAGVLETMYLKETINLIKTIQPNIKELIAIVDNSNTSTTHFEIYQTLKEEIQDIELSEIWTPNLTIKELQNKISKLTNDVALIRLGGYNMKDANLNIYEQFELFYKNSPVPVYCDGVIDIYIGFTGGYLSDYHEQARGACEIAKDVLNGTAISNKKIIYNSPGKNILNFQSIQKYDNLAITRIPKGTNIINGPSKKLNIRKDLFFSILLFLLTTLIFLFVIVRLYILKQRITNKLKISQRNYETLFRESPSINLLIDPGTGKIADANNTALDFYGYNINEIRNLKINDINVITSSESIWEKMQQIPPGVIKGIISTQRKKNGTIRDVEIFTGHLNFNNKSFLHTIVVDITDRLKAEREIIEAKQKAEESDNLKSAFLANMSHEIRTPMNSILGFSDLLINEKTPKNKQIEFLNLIYANGNHLLNLINDIIDISKIEANQLKVIKKETQINLLLDELYSEFNNKRITEGLKFDLKLIKGHQDAEYHVFTDCIRLKQILINLISNAYKFTEEGVIQFGYKIREDGMLQFFVKDTGIGIPKDKHETIFSVFQRLEDSYTKNYTGAGLGLSISRSLVEKLGGHIWLMSEEGIGSRFYFTIPGVEETLKM